MAHDVFISHSSKDKQIADSMCNKLESNGIRCWMAPRDILPGSKWSEAITEAIEESSLLVLIFSKNANTSDQIEKELDIASDNKRLVLPFRVEDVKPSGSLKYHLGNRHWLDAMTPPLENHLNQLVETVRRHMRDPLRQTTPAKQTSPPSPMPEKPIRVRDAFPTTLKNKVGMEFVYVPSGDFMMGSELFESAKPVHQVSFREGFYMGKHEVTQGQWYQVTGKNFWTHTIGNPPRFKGDNLPMENVSWHDTQKLIRKLNAKDDGFTYRLPSEAEWEYACRAGTTGDYAGDLDSMAWYVKNSGREHLDLAVVRRPDGANFDKPLEDNGGQTHPVGQKQPNGFGLYDMHGNVAEWCHDHHHGNYYGAPVNGSAWLLAGSDSWTRLDPRQRVLRGGSWDGNAVAMHSAYRFGIAPGYYNNNIGLRLVAVRR